MKQKIEWYKELLELEPGSKVFFPLARLLAADGRLLEAVQILQQGVVRHPDHVESRLLLVELLDLQQDTAAMRREVESLSALLRGYPQFWSAWSDALAAVPSMQDAALALRFFAAALQGKSITWASVIEQGLRTVAADGTVLQHFSAPVDNLEEISFAKSNPDLPQQTIDAAENSLASSIPVATLIESVDDDESDSDDNEEPFSLRTRTMAEVLAEQGDYAGAIDIYQDLIEAAQPEEVPALHARVEELTARMASPGAPGKGDGKQNLPSEETNRLRTLLGNLALRIEERAR